MRPWVQFAAIPHW